MMKKNQQGPMENLLEGLDQQAECLSTEELKTELSKRGIDVAAFLDRAHAIIAQHEKADRLAWMKVADDNKSRLEKIGTVESWIGKSEQAIREAWANFLSTMTPSQALAFRKKTELTTEDMARILDDNERLRLSQTKDKPPKQD